MNHEILDNGSDLPEKSLWRQATESVSLKVCLLFCAALGHAYLLLANDMLMLSFISTFGLLLVAYFIFAILLLFVLTLVIFFLHEFIKTPTLQKLNDIVLFSNHIFLNTMLLMGMGLLAMVSCLILFD